MIFGKLDKVCYGLTVQKKEDYNNYVLVIIFWYVRTKDIGYFLSESSLVLQEIKIMGGVWLINKKFKVVQGYFSQVRNSKEYLICVF